MFDENEFRQFVKGLTDEKEQSPYNLTIEFCTGSAHLPEKIKILSEYNTDKYVWQIRYCEISAGYDPEFPFHVELIEWT